MERPPCLHLSTPAPPSLVLRHRLEADIRLPRSQHGPTRTSGGDRRGVRLGIAIASSIAISAMRCSHRDHPLKAPRADASACQVEFKNHGRNRSAILLSVSVVIALVLALPSASPAAVDLPQLPNGSALAAAAAEFAQSANSSVGVLAFACAHLLAILACFPGAIAFELAAGAIFGLVPGTVLVAAVKGIAVASAYALTLTLRDSPPGRWVQERARSATGGDAEWVSRLRAGVARDGFKFCVLARLSPVPSWINNYVLPLAGVSFATYLPASLLGMLLPLAGNVYSGAAAASVAAVLSGTAPSLSAGGGFDLVLPALSALSGVAVVQQLAGDALGAASADRQEAGRDEGGGVQ
eukprot:CAMPEP_0117494796 /NCGR_PEP_ID=MMETSP0784-20121206/19799_1 /TAXON_ID=39447 /ORGANISM="" /LENGTH=352 /DNA_ID=CAMNT_0005289693 /DNA_START=59 /DNA_END=1117 /DNA_ORIENTATION=+